MKLLDIIDFLINPEKLKSFFYENSINQEFESLLIYMKDSIDIDAELYFFGMEETDDDLVYKKDGTIFHQFFPIDYVIELLEFDLNLKNSGLSNLEMAQRLVEYRINDA